MTVEEKQTTVGEQIKEYMKDNGIKQVFVAEKAGICPQILGQILNGNRKIEVKEFFKICEATGADPTNFAITAGIYKQKNSATA